MFFVLGILSIMITFWMHGKFLGRIRDGYPDLYGKLGRPTAFTKYPLSSKLIVKDLSSSKSLTKYSEFMSKKEWRNLGDLELEKYTKFKTYAQCAALVFILLAFFYHAS